MVEVEREKKKEVEKKEKKTKHKTGKGKKAFESQSRLSYLPFFPRFFSRSPRPALKSRRLGHAREP